MQKQYGTDRQTTADNIIRRMRFACRVIEENTHTQTVCNTYRFSTATIVTRTCLSVNLSEPCILYIRRA